MGSRRSDFGDGASPGKIFIGGLAKDTTLDQFVKYFSNYGEITDSVIMKDRHTGRPRGFGFITYADPSVVDAVIAETHIINDKQVEIKRTIPKGAADSKDFTTRKIFVGGIPPSLTEDEVKEFFSKYGKVVEHEIIRDHVTNRSRGFGFVVFDSEQVVDNLLVDGNRIDMNGNQVEIKKAEPKKPSNPAPGPAYASNSRGRGYSGRFGGYDSYNSYARGGGFGPAPYRSFGGMGGRFGDYGPYGVSGGDYDGRYNDFSGDYVGYRGEPSLGYSSRFGSYAGGLGGGYSGSGLGGYGRGGAYGSFGGPSSGAGYDSGPGAAGYGAGGLYGARAGYSGGSRYHPYAR